MLDAERRRNATVKPWVPSLHDRVCESAHRPLGTFWLIDAFVGIASQDRETSEPSHGVAEALIATAAALSVAIPAVFAYNIFASRLNKIEGQLESFGSELIALMVREGMI